MLTNLDTGSTLFPGPSSKAYDGSLAAVWLASPTNVNAVITVARNDGYSECGTNYVEWNYRTNRSQRFLIYWEQEPPSDQPIEFGVQWPVPALEIIDLKWPDETNTSRVTFLVSAPQNEYGTNVWQLWYSQLLVARDATNWIPHVSFYGQVLPFEVSQVAHITHTNRPYGFWELRGGAVVYSGAIGDEHVDPPLDYPPMPEPCEDCPPGDPTPPLPN
jgi:hypothetical protein